MGKTAQLDMLDAEKKRANQIMTTQYDQQYTQQKLAIEQAYKQQHSQLEMAKTQRDMAIQQQAAQMTAVAQQYAMQVELQNTMAKAYGTAFAGGEKKGSTNPATDKGTTPPKKGGKTPPKK